MTAKPLEKLLHSTKAQYAFVNPPRRAAEASYKDFKERLLRECARTPGLLALYLDARNFHYSAGTLSAIGVFDPKLVNASKGDLVQALNSADEQSLVTYEVLCLTPELFRSLRKIDCLLEPEHFWGQKFPIDTVPTEEKRYQYVIRLMDFFVAGYFEPFVHGGVEREVDTMTFLARIGRLALILDMAKEILRQESIPKWDEFQKGARDCVAKWHSRNLKRYMDVMPLVPVALEVLLEAIEKLDAYFVKSNIVKMKPSQDADTPQAAFVTEEQAVAFIHPWTSARALEIMLHLRKEHEQFVEVLPASFALQLYEYCKGSGTFHKYIKSCFKMEVMTGHMERPNLSLDRGDLLDQYAQFVSGTKIDSDSSLVLGCNLRAGFAVAKALSFVKSQKNVSRRNKFMKLLLQSEQRAFSQEP